MDIRRETRELAVELTRHESVNGTAGERSFAAFLERVLRSRPRLAAAGLVVFREAAAGDSLARENVYALLPGNGTRTVLLTGHYDTVAVSDYGELVDLATDPDGLAAAWLERDAAQEAAWMREVASGDFLPGRGLLDMKSGLAAAIVALEILAARGPRAGNLLFLATFDEEGGSTGMRVAAQKQLPAIFQQHDLEPVLAINLDALAAAGDGADGQVVAFGTMGKLLLTAYCIGRETHACYPSAGTNAAVMAAVLGLAFEGCAALTDTSQPQAPPPVTLQLRDLKSRYDVTTPGRACAYWNVILYERGAARILEQAGCVAREALAAALPAMPCPILTFSELLELARARGGASFQREFDQLEGLSLATLQADVPEQSMALTAKAWEASGMEGPAVILGFGSTPYPPCRFGPQDERLRRILEDVVSRVAADRGTRLAITDYLGVISDMSFLGPIDTDDLRRVRANTPAWQSRIGWNIEGAGTPGIPCINAGPWGRGYHNARERVFQPYAFDILPGLVAEMAAAALAAT